MARKKSSLQFDRRGGVVAIQRFMLASPAFLGLSPHAKVLMQLMHVHWRPDKPVAYGCREAAEKIPCSRKLAMRAFQELQGAGFIEMVDESLFDSRTNSKSRTWRLTWLPFGMRKPTNDWEKIASENAPKN